MIVKSSRLVSDLDKFREGQPITFKVLSAQRELEGRQWLSRQLASAPKVAPSNLAGAFGQNTLRLPKTCKSLAPREIASDSQV